jgi:hypothetical protein
MGIFWYKSIGLIVIGPCSCSRSLYMRGAVLTLMHFFTERALEGGKPGIV